jgi:hypothetical protein
MEYVRGETLRQRLDAGALSLKDALRIAMEVAEALRRRIRHRSFTATEAIQHHADR